MKHRILSAVLMAALVVPLFASPIESFAQVKKNRAPSISGISAPTMLAVDQTGTWTVNASDPENGNLSYSVDWGDAVLAKSFAANAGFVQSATFSHSYATAGTYTVAFTVRDDAGATSKSSVTVYVRGDQTNPLVITNAKATSSKPTKAIVTWTTNIKADSSVWYATTSPIDTSKKPSIVKHGHTKDHRIELGKLAPDTTYYVVVKSSAKNASAISSEFSFKTPPAKSDSPKITSIDGPSSLTVDEEGMWTLTAKDPKNSDLAYSVDWGDEGNFLTKALSKMMPSYVQTSTFTHTYADAGTYTITFKVKNLSGYTDEKTASVTVTGSSDTTVPAISGVSVGSIDSDSALITWNTDEAADSSIYFSTSSPVVIGDAGTTEVSENALVTNHSLSASGLTASTTYYFLVQSADGVGNVGTSSQAAFTTAGL